MVGGAAVPPLHVVSERAEGTVIGSIPDGPDVIADVGRGVSRNHLRIWREYDPDSHSRWMVQGLGSTNGTILMSGSDHAERVVEPPRSLRGDEAWPPVEVDSGDTLVLGPDTSFLVLKTLTRLKASQRL